MIKRHQLDRIFL